jgi:protein ImuB
VDRLACVDLPALPLQLLLRRHPEWATHPAAVVVEERPQAPILCLNNLARERGILPGMRYAQGLSLAAELRAGAVGATEVASAVDELAGILRRFSPNVEPASSPGVFWLDAHGLQRVHPSLTRWARALLRDLRGAGFSGAVVVGFSRFGTAALARLTDGARVLDSPEEERALARRVPLKLLDIPPALRDALARLGVHDVEGLLRLPAGGLLERFGPEAERLHRLASGALWSPLQPTPELAPVRETLDLDDPETDLPRLLFLLKRRLDRMLRSLAERHEALTALRLGLRYADRTERETCVRPAAPTLDGVQLLDLLRLRLDQLVAAAPRGDAEAQRAILPGEAALAHTETGVVCVELHAESTAAAEEQLQLFVEKPPRDLEAANLALARVRAELGEGSVVCAILRDKHLPEARFTWEPLERLALACARAPRGELRPLVRRLLPAAASLRSEDPGGSHGPAHASRDVPPRPVRQGRGGPYLIVGGWWRREVHREYHFAESRSGALLWLYYDRERQRWLLHGIVE